MSTKNTITRIAAAIADRDKAHLDAKVTALAEVVTNTHRKMTHPAGFDWALHHSFKVLSITPTHLKVEARKGRSNEHVLLDIPRSDLSLSTWQVTSSIRRQSAERLLADLNATVTHNQDAVAENRKAVTEAKERLQQSERALSDAKAAVDRRLARLRTIEAKREVTRARRKTDAPKEAVAAQ